MSSNTNKTNRTSIKNNIKKHNNDGHDFNETPKLAATTKEQHKVSQQKSTGNYLLKPPNDFEPLPRAKTTLNDAMTQHKNPQKTGINHNA